MSSRSSGCVTLEGNFKGTGNRVGYTLGSYSMGGARVQLCAWTNTHSYKALSFGALFFQHVNLSGASSLASRSREVTDEWWIITVWGRRRSGDGFKAGQSETLYCSGCRHRSGGCESSFSIGITRRPAQSLSDLFVKFNISICLVFFNLDISAAFTENPSNPRHRFLSRYPPVLKASRSCGSRCKG